MDEVHINITKSDHSPCPLNPEIQLLLEALIEDLNLSLRECQALET